MKEYYDLIVNYKKIAYDFFEWDKKDNIIHIKSIPAFKVSLKTLNDFLNNDVKITDSFLNKIKDKTLIYSNKVVKKLEYACILYTDFLAVSFLFNKNHLILRSKLIYEEENEIILNSFDEITEIEYEVKDKIHHFKYKTRKENIIYNKIISFIEKTKKENNHELIDYLFYDCYNKLLENKEDEYKKIKEEVNSNNKFVIKKILSIINCSSKTV